MSLAETLRRTTIPSLIVTLSRVETPAKLSAQLRRALGQSARIELFFAFDDPYAAIALPGLLRIVGQHKATLTLYPIVSRGIADDPAADARRRHAVTDSACLAQRHGRKLSRREPLRASDCAFLAAWTESARNDPGMIAFAAAALDLLWFQSSGAVSESDFRRLHAQHLHSAAVAHNDQALARNTQRLLRGGHWESPAARIEGQWFLAHERLVQINEHLERLGW